MAEALAPLMGDAIRKQVEDSQDDVIDALYPIVGQMVSKAIKEAMKNLIDTVNRNINRRFGYGLWFKRLKARLMGIEFGQVLIAEEAPFGIAELFLISKHQSTN